VYLLYGLEIILNHLTRRKFRLFRPTQGQSFVELALVLPVLLLMLLGMVEVAFFISRYLDVLDLTREAARFASVRGPMETSDLDCSTTDALNFFYDTACMMSPPADQAATCQESKYCNGFNPYLMIDLTKDDVVISVFTVAENSVSGQLPEHNGYWALSNVDFADNKDLNLTDDADTLTNNFWRDCQGNEVRDKPYYTADKVNDSLLTNAPENKGFVAVEIYYCYEQVLGIPIVTDIIPNPIQIRAYTIMPLPAAKPTPTNIVATPTP